MKFILVIAIFTLSLSCVAEPVAAKKTLPVSNLDVSKIKLPKEEPKKEADCDKKAAEPIVIKEETISLTGNTGCSLDEEKP